MKKKASRHILPGHHRELQCSRAEVPVEESICIMEIACSYFKCNMPGNAQRDLHLMMEIFGLYSQQLEVTQYIHRSNTICFQNSFSLCCYRK